MKLLFPFLFLFLATHSGAVERDLLRCVRHTHILGAPVYALSIDERPGSPIRYYLKMVPQNPTVPPIYLEIPRPVHYGDTWIATADRGRSGYAHLYAHGSATLLDVNLFTARYRVMNTSGPLRDYSCTTSP